MWWSFFARLAGTAERTCVGIYKNMCIYTDILIYYTIYKVVLSMNFVIFLIIFIKKYILFVKNEEYRNLLLYFFEF